MPNQRDIKDLQQLQALPLSLKIKLTQQRIRQWVNEYGEEGVYISFSGGKDSTVLLHLVRELYPDVPAVFCDVPTQYPELKEFATSFDNVVVVKPKISFAQVCEKFGFPLISKEVSETVAGARKYLTRVLESEQLGDRQTDRRRREVLPRTIRKGVRTWTVFSRVNEGRRTRRGDIGNGQTM